MKGCCTWIAVLLLAIPTARAQQLGASGLRAPSNDSNANAADVTRAKLAFESGQRAFDAGRFEEAADSFEHAYELSGRPELLFDLGLAADRLRDDERALEAFQRFLEMSQDTELRKQVEQRVAALQAARDRKRAQERRARERAERDAELAPARVAASSQQPRNELLVPPYEEPRDEADEGGVLSQWWFWTGAVVLIAGGATTAYLLTRESPESELPEPNTGRVITTLRFAP